MVLDYPKGKHPKIATAQLPRSADISIDRTTVAKNLDVPVMKRAKKPLDIFPRSKKARHGATKVVNVMR
jgi:hypothetical protein